MKEEYPVFTLFLNTTGKRVFQTGRALAGIDHCLLSVVYENYRNLPHFNKLLVHFIQIVLPLPLYEYKDLSLVKQMYQYMVFFFPLIPVEFSIPGHFS